MSRPITIAAAQYPIGRPSSWQEYAANLETWVGGAGDADLLVFPEYAAMELASLFGPAVEADLSLQLEAVAGLEQDVAGLHADLARRHGVHILGASLPARVGERRFHNRARLYRPDGTSELQDKIVMTRFEREQWGVSGADELRVIETPMARLGVCICYDVEFPLLARRLVESGAEVILAPSCTESLRGHHRVRIGARARALEGQCVSVQSPTIGAAPWSPAVDMNRGAAGIYGPPDAGFPEDGVLAHGEPDRPCWVHATVDLDRIAEVRAAGSVLNHRDWPEQERTRIVS